MGRGRRVSVFPAAVEPDLVTAPRDLGPSIPGHAGHLAYSPSQAGLSPGDLSPWKLGYWTLLPGSWILLDIKTTFSSL